MTGERQRKAAADTPLMPDRRAMWERTRRARWSPAVPPWHRDVSDNSAYPCP